MTNYWIFTASKKSKKEAGGEKYSSAFIYKRRMEDGYWGLGLKTKNNRKKKNRSKIQAGDYVLFYIGVPDSSFVGTAKLSTGVVENTPKQRASISRGDKSFFDFTHGVYLEEIRALANPVEIKEIVSKLSFIKNKADYRGSLRGGVIPLPAEDYHYIMGKSAYFADDLPSDAYEAAEKEDSFDPNDLEDTRRRVEKTIASRRGQREFRLRLLAAYQNRCAVTGCDTIYALEAAHICPYINEERHKISNGLLLRSDIHTLFDLGHIAIDGDLRIIVSDVIAGSEYGKSLIGLRLKIPVSPQHHPSKIAIKIHREEFHKRHSGRIRIAQSNGAK